MLENTMNDVLGIIQPPMLIDEVSDTEYYIGISRNDSDESRKVWRIERIWKSGNIWRFGYPDGDQSFSYEWSKRYTYTYSQ